MERVKLFDSVDKAKETLPNNQPRLVRIGQIEVCIVRLDETFLAVQNACTHLGERLHKGHINYLGEIICPLHAYRFNLKTGEETKQRCAALDTFQVVEKDGILFLELDA